MRTFTLLVVLFSLAAHADPPSPEQLAKLQRDIEKATDEVDKKYAGKELSQDEKKQQIKDRAAAEASVLDKAGVDKKDFARASAKMSKEDRSAVAAEKDKLEKNDKAAGAGKQGGAGNGEVIVEKGGKGGQPMTPEEEAAAMDKQNGYGKGGSKKGKGKH